MDNMKGVGLNMATVLDHSPENCYLCSALMTVLQTDWRFTRQQLMKEIKTHNSSTTVFDHLNNLERNNYIKSMMIHEGIKGRPYTYWEIKH
jgi:predicted ArsR family transcriptional regulator